MDFEVLITFALVSTVICMMPGPDNIFVFIQTALYGYQSGLFVVMGLCTGLIVHTLIVTFGIATLFQSSPLAFNILKYIGVSYLLYLAWQAFKFKPLSLSNQSDSKLSYKAYYIRGFIMNVTNPKVSLFFLAFLPQFVKSGSHNLSFQFMVLGVIIIMISFMVFTSLVLIASMIGNKLNQYPQSQVYLNRFAAFIFVGLAIKLILSKATV